MPALHKESLVVYVRFPVLGHNQTNNKIILCSAKLVNG